MDTVSEIHADAPQATASEGLERELMSGANVLLLALSSDVPKVLSLFQVYMRYRHLQLPISAVSTKVSITRI